jgi:hypothetical protein
MIYLFINLHVSTKYFFSIFLSKKLGQSVTNGSFLVNTLLPFEWAGKNIYKSIGHHI